MDLRLYLKTLLLVLLPATAYSQVDSIKAGPNKLRPIQPGKASYAVWFQDTTSNTVSQISIWNREVFFSRLNGTTDVVVVRQMRYYSDQKRNKSVYTVSDRKTLRTIYDFMSRGGLNEAFNYSAKSIEGADSVKNNSKKDFRLSFNDLPFCFEMDLEVLSLLPITRVGQKFAVNFYHPGGEIPPKYHPVEVVGQEVFQTIGRKPVSCWKIRLRYDETSFDYSWITTESHELLRLEGHYDNMIFNKVKLGVAAPQ